jgi:tetratricopeptide (TPR) repeat protein
VILRGGLVVTQSKRLRFWLLAGAAALGGGGFAASVTLGGERVAAAATPSAAPISDADFILCHTPAKGGFAASVAWFRVAATQTEVPPTEMQAAAPAPDFVNTFPPLWDGLGTLTYKITTDDPQAQAYFDQGLRLTYGFNHDEARRAFREAQHRDPDCAMCYWGEALVLGPNINMPMPDEAVAPAFAAAQKAQALASSGAKRPVTARERALITALAVRYAPDPKADRAVLDAAYAAAMGQVSKQFLNDDDIAVLYAESVMDLSPWDYWKSGGAEPNPQSAPIIPTLERVLARNPTHPGAQHYYIHAVEASDRPGRAERAADQLRGTMPGAGHMVHMPGHIYYRIGRYFDALAVNKDAVAADEKYLQASDAPMGVYRLGYYPHNVHFILASATMSGDGAAAIAAAEKLNKLIPNDRLAKAPGAQTIKAAIYFAHAQFSAPDTVLALSDPLEAGPYVRAMWRYARGVVQARKGDLDAARAEASAISTLAKTGNFDALKEAGIPALDVLKLAQAVVEGRVAQAKGDSATAIARFSEAAAIQDALRYTEPPYWYYPVRQSLAAALMQAGKLDQAREQFQLALKRAPNNGWTYYGLAQLYRKRGNAKATADAEAQLAKTWIGDRALLDVSRL